MIVGIDLGTTHSLIGVYEDGAPRLIPNALGQLLTPSVVSLDPDRGVLVGQAAHDRLGTDAACTVATFKRWMGSSRETRLGQRTFRAEELSALVLRSLLDDARAALGREIDEAVISVPAYFGDAQRKATRAAGELAGIRVERLINEPTAAAIAYGLQERVDGSTFMVLDLGGGTFDVSILEIFDGVIQVHASAGDNHLGGEDFLDLLVGAFIQDHRLQRNRLSPADMAQLRKYLQVAKHRLSAHDQAEVELELDGRTLRWAVDQERFTSLAEPLVQRLRQPIERALRDARLGPDRLDEVVMVGGASRMPVFTRTAARTLGRLPLRHVHPDEAIALGAAAVAGMKARDESLEEVVLTDVCPYTLGVETARTDDHGYITNGHFSPIIDRNCTVPVSRVEVFYPMQEGQRQVDLQVFQGESPRTEHNVALGKLTVPLRRNVPKHENGVEVRFTYDVNGVLQVEARAQSTGVVHELIIQDNLGVLDEAEIRERLARLQSLKIHPREDQANLAVLARIERLYEEHLQLRGILQDWMGRFMGVIELQDRERISQHRTELARALDELETQVG
ncbi:MAG: Hsp70 family protein [Pseudoxanthomonas sp.]|nr:Hsp70 family protein [Pseudoxanthomonas sp.]